MSDERSPDPFASSDVGSDSPARGASSLRDIRILVVEDFATMRRVMRNLLNDLGYARISEADDGSVALPMLHNQHFDLVITDLLMPEMGGLELLRVIRADSALRHIPVMIVTADAQREKILAAAQAGVDAYFVKPFTAAMLESKIRELFCTNTSKT